MVSRLGTISAWLKKVPETESDIDLQIIIYDTYDIRLLGNWE